MFRGKGKDHKDQSRSDAVASSKDGALPPTLTAAEIKPQNISEKIKIIVGNLGQTLDPEFFLNITAIEHQVYAPFEKLEKLKDFFSGNPSTQKILQDVIRVLNIHKNNSENIQLACLTLDLLLSQLKNAIQPDTTDYDPTRFLIWTNIIQILNGQPQDLQLWKDTQNLIRASSASEEPSKVVAEIKKKILENESKSLVPEKKVSVPTVFFKPCRKLIEPDPRIVASLAWKDEPIPITEPLNEEMLLRICQGVSHAYFIYSGNCALLSSLVLYSLKINSVEISGGNVSSPFAGIPDEEASRALFHRELDALQESKSGNISQLCAAIVSNYESHQEKFFYLKVHYNSIFRLATGKTSVHCLNAVVLDQGAKIAFVDAWDGGVILSPEGFAKTYGSNFGFELYAHRGEVVPLERPKSSADSNLLNDDVKFSLKR